MLYWATDPLVRLLPAKPPRVALRAPPRQNIKQLARATHQFSSNPSPPPPPNVRHRRRIPRRSRSRLGADQVRGPRLRRAPIHTRYPVRQEHAARLQDPRRGQRPPRHRSAQRPLSLPGDGGVEEEGGVHLLPRAPLHLLLLLRPRRTRRAALRCPCYYCVWL